jgi:hypothetical protein
MGGMDALWGLRTRTRCLPFFYSVDKRATATDNGRIWGSGYDLARGCHTTYGLIFFALLLQVDFNFMISYTSTQLLLQELHSPQSQVPLTEP